MTLPGTFHVGFISTMQPHHVSVTRFDDFSCPKRYDSVRSFRQIVEQLLARFLIEPTTASLVYFRPLQATFCRIKIGI